MPDTDQRPAPGRIFLVERYWPGVTQERFRDHVAVLDEIGGGRRGVDPAAILHLGSVLVLDDEVILSLFQAPSRDVLRARHEGRKLAPDRILEVIRLGRGGR